MSGDRLSHIVSVWFTHNLVYKPSGGKPDTIGIREIVHAYRQVSTSRGLFDTGSLVMDTISLLIVVTVLFR